MEQPELIIDDNWSLKRVDPYYNGLPRFHLVHRDCGKATERLFPGCFAGARQRGWERKDEIYCGHCSVDAAVEARDKIEFLLG